MTTNLDEDILKVFMALFLLVLLLLTAKYRQTEQQEFLVEVGLRILEGDDSTRFVQVDDAIG